MNIRSAALAAIIVSALSPAVVAEGVRVQTADRSAAEVYASVVKAAHALCKDQAIAYVHDRADVARCVLDTVSDAVSRSQSVELAMQHEARTSASVQIAAR